MKKQDNNFSFRYLHSFEDIEKWEESLKNKTESFWLQRGKKMQLALFFDMAKRVPAYKKFLRTNNINLNSIRTQQDLARVPSIDKNNYLRAYALPELCWDGDLTSVHKIISSTSGSSGEPFFFPRTKTQDDQYALIAELYMRANFSIQHKRTLYINAFPLGVWIGGLFTFSAITRLAERGKYPLSIINPGINISAVITAIKKFEHEYDQIIIGSYGPFLKDIIDEGELQGIHWSKINLGFVFSAEVFSEEFRKHILKYTSKKNPLTATLNHYGTVDLGTMSYETPLAILARQLILSSEITTESLFHGKWKTPTLTQYMPEMFYFEDGGKNDLYVSGYSGIPLVRYDLKDRGNVYTKKFIESELSKSKIDLEKISKQSGISASTWNLPFVQVFERTDMSVSYYAFQVYPETIRRALIKKEFSLITSGKFTMQVTYNTSFKQELHIYIEAMPAVKQVSKTSSKKILEAIHHQLLSENSEYAKTHNEKGKRALPNISFFQHGDPKFFTSGAKQKWVK